MNIMGIGGLEIAVIAVIALLVFGPAKLPEVMGQAGKMVRDFRRMSAELSGEFEKTIAEARDATDGLAAELGGMTKEVNSITNSVKKDLGVKGRSTTTGSKSTSGSKSSASKSSTSKKSSSSRSSSTSTSKAGGKAGGKTGSTTTGSKSTSSTTKTTASKKPVVPVATREDPTADVFLFEPAPVERATRSRKAVPSVISDPTPRVGDMVLAETETIVVEDAIPTDAISRARQRRRNAGYARASA